MSGSDRLMPQRVRLEYDDVDESLALHRFVLDET